MPHPQTLYPTTKQGRSRSQETPWAFPHPIFLRESFCPCTLQLDTPKISFIFAGRECCGQGCPVDYAVSPFPNVSTMLV